MARHRAPDTTPNALTIRLVPVALGAGLVALVAVALFFGRAPGGSWHWLDASELATTLPWRWPRSLAVASAGALLASAGFVLQRLTGNEKASPEILGVSAGSTFAVAIGLFVISDMSSAQALVAAIIGAVATLFLVLLLGRRSGFAPERMLLAGIAISALLDAVIGVLSATGDPRSFQLLAWMAGAASAVQPTGALSALVAGIIVLGLTLLACRPMTLLVLGAPNAGGLGLTVRTARLLLLALAALATAAATPIVGPLTFVGLIAPHLVRLGGVRAVLPSLIGSAFAGAAILLAADWLARVAAYPFQLPTGLVACLVGAPVLFWLLQRRAA